MENLSRSELEKKIGGLEAQIAELQNAALKGNEINLDEIAKLQNELELLNDELDEMTRSDGDVEPKTKVKIKEYTIDDDKENMEQNVREQENVEQEKTEKEREQQDEMIENDQEVEPQEDGERRLTLLDWQKESGVELLPDDAIKKKYDKFLTREEFMAILDTENVPKIIREPGRAESFLKSDEDWRAVETSDSSLREAINAGNIPIDVDNDDYIKRQYGDGKEDNIIDNTEEKNEDGYGKIDEDDIAEVLEGDEKQEENDEHDVEEDIDESIEDVSKSEESKATRMLAYIAMHPELAIEDEKERDDDEYEIAPPKIIKH